MDIKRYYKTMLRMFLVCENRNSHDWIDSAHSFAIEETFVDAAPSVDFFFSLFISNSFFTYLVNRLKPHITI